jgi:hypothetical protein
VLITTKGVSSNPVHGEIYSIQHYMIKCQWLAAGWWFSLGTQISSTNKTDRHDITEMLLKVASNTINLTIYMNKRCYFFIPSPTKLRGDIVTLPSVRHNPCEHSRINILPWIVTKLGTYLVLKRIWNRIDFQGHRSKVKVTGSNF